MITGGEVMNVEEPSREKVRHKYWLGRRAKEVVTQLERYDNSQDTVGRNPFYAMWYRNSYAYYSTVLDADSVATSLNYRGEQGELVSMSVPEARSLVRDVITLTTKQKLNFRAILKKDGSKQTDTMRMANAFIDEKTRNGRLDTAAEHALEQAVVLGTGFLGSFWRFDRGALVGQNKHGGAIYEGQSEILSIHPADLVMDYTIENFDDQSWVRLRFKRNRHDLIALYPELEEKIMALPGILEDASTTKQTFDLAGDRDQVYEYCLLHRASPALRYGRFICYSSADTIYYDDDNIYPTGIPVVPVIPEKVMGYGLGYPLFSSILPAQEMLDHEFSVTATNHSALGVRNIVAPQNSNLDVKALGGLNLITYKVQDVQGGGKPDTLSFDQPHTDFYQFSERLQASMQRMTKLNNAIRGEISSAASGVAIATLTTNAIDFLSGYQKALYNAVEEVLYHDVAINSRMVKADRELTYDSGRGGGHMDSVNYTGEDLKAIQGISLVAVNPMMQTMAGRIDIGDKLLDKTGADGQPLIKNIKEYFAILDGAPPERLYQNELSEDDLLVSVKEMLLQGEIPPVLAGDNIPRLAQYAFSLLNDMEVRLEGSITPVILQFIEECKRVALMSDPFLQAIIQTGMMPQLPPPGMGDGSGGGGPPPQGSEPKNENPMLKAAPGDGTPALPQPKPANDLLGRNG